MTRLRFPPRMLQLAMSLLGVAPAACSRDVFVSGSWLDGGADRGDRRDGLLR